MTLDELEALLEKATPGPWLVHGPSAAPSGVPTQWQHYYEIRVDDGSKDGWPYRIAGTLINAAQSAHDYALIAALRNEAPRLLAAARENERMREALEKIRRTPSMPFPDPGAHSAAAWGRAVYTAWKQIQGTAAVALKETQNG